MRRVRSMWVMMVVFFLAAALVVPFLEHDALSGDELNTIIAAGGAHHGPLTWPMGIIEKTNERSPDQALGFPLVARLWGDFVGWGEFEIRVWSLLTGLLVLAVTYRIGTDMFNEFVGISAALTLATSMFFTIYMHKFRVFTIVALSVAGAIWCYYRIALAPGKAGWFAQVGLVLAGVGLTYTHYFATPFVGALGLFHLLFVKKDARWWRPVILFGVVMLIFLPQLGFLYDGVVHNSVKRPDLRQEAMSPWNIFRSMMYFFGNGTYVSSVLLLGLGVFAFVRLPKDAPKERTQQRIFLLISGVVLLLVGIIAMNEIAGVMPPRRVRYLMGLWVPLSLLAGVGLWKLRDYHRYLPGGVLAIWVIFGIGVNVEGSLMTFPTGDNGPVPPWREFRASILDNSDPTDTLLYFGVLEPRLGHYTHGMDFRNFIPPYFREDDIREAVGDANRVWFAYKKDWNQEGNLTRMYEILDERGYEFCEGYLNDEHFNLRVYTLSPSYCPGGGAPIMTFGEQITLMEVEEVRTDDTLTLHTGWQPSPQMPVYTYSIGFHIYDEDGEFVTNQDIGLGAADGPYTSVRASFDLSDLPEGEYEVRLVVYDFNTGARLMGVNHEDASNVGDLLLLERFAVEV